tara:strand:- start:11028 stop:11507 length:480 start_codon:yes stop_codon:yes gene_type:complete
MVEEKINNKELRKALGCFPTGITIVTTENEDEEPIGLTVNSFNSISLDPPLIIWSISLNTPSISAFRYNKSFAVNILSSDQKVLCEKFSTPATNKFDGIAWEKSPMGIPLIIGSVAQFECITHATYPGGDHEIYVGRVINYTYNNKEPLILSKGKINGS